MQLEVTMWLFNLKVDQLILCCHSCEPILMCALMLWCGNVIIVRENSYNWSWSSYTRSLVLEIDLFEMWYFMVINVGMLNQLIEFMVDQYIFRCTNTRILLEICFVYL